jgi:hypothetical protein
LDYLTTLYGVVILANMPVKLMLSERHAFSGISFVEMVVWRVPVPIRGSSHDFKYRLALVVRGVCVLRYDNESGKGDHRHKGDEETSYRIISPQELLTDFWQEVDNWRP